MVGKTVHSPHQGLGPDPVHASNRQGIGKPTISDYANSYYAATANAAVLRPALEGDIEADICVVGGGFTGTSAALHLAGLGYKVVLLEAERIGWGASGRNGGIVGVGQRRGQDELEARFGDEKARILWDFGLEAVNLVKGLIAEHGIQCDLKPGILELAAKQSHVAEMREEQEKLYSRYGYHQLRFLDKSETDRMIGSDKFHAGQLDMGSVHLHPLNYVLGLGAAAEGAGATLFEHSRVQSFANGSKVLVRTPGGSVSARYLVIGCNGYLGKLDAGMAAKIMPVNNFMLATEPLSSADAKALIRDDIAVADTLFVVNYWRLSADKRLLFGGGETYSSRFPTDMKAFVRKYMLRVYPQLAETRIDYAWGGRLAITLDRMPDFGRLADNVFFAQGYSGHGVAMATMAGKLLAEAVSGTAERFDVMASLPTRRFPGGVMLRWPGLVLGMLYYALRDRL